MIMGGRALYVHSCVLIMSICSYASPSPPPPQLKKKICHVAIKRYLLLPSPGNRVEKSGTDEAQSKRAGETSVLS